MTTQPQSPSEQEIRDCVDQAASTDYKVMCLQALIAQAADKREQEVLDDTEKTLLSIHHEPADTGSQFAQETIKNIMSGYFDGRRDRLRQGRAAEGSE
jgi:hypothetical protein